MGKTVYSNGAVVYDNATRVQRASLDRAAGSSGCALPARAILSGAKSVTIRPDSAGQAPPQLQADLQDQTSEGDPENSVKPFE